MIWLYLEVGARGWLAGHIIESPSANNSKASGRYSVKCQVDVVVRRHLQPVCIRAIEAPKTKTVRHQPNQGWLYRTSFYLPSRLNRPPDTVTKPVFQRALRSVLEAKAIQNWRMSVIHRARDILDMTTIPQEDRRRILDL